jgi:UPF0271 protein
MESSRTIDLNCDMGESFGNWRMGDDERLMTVITTANVACGFHGGDPATMLETVRSAKQRGVVVGAHPGLPDLLGFGRRTMAISPTDAYAYVLYQIGALQAALAATGLPLHHVKPHGAMSGMLNDDSELAAAVAQAVRDGCEESPIVYWPAPAEGSAFARESGALGIRVVPEMYPDLEYDSRGRLILQRTKQATDIARAGDQVRRFLLEGRVVTAEDTQIELEAESVCVHGDGPNAYDVACEVKRVVEGCGLEVKAIGAPGVEGPVGAVENPASTTVDG